MRKRLAIFGLLVLVGGAWSQVPRDGSKQHENTQDLQKSADPPKPAVAIESAAGANNQERAAEKPAEYPWSELLAPANVPNWFLVAVGAITGWFVYKTLRAIKKQADIMETQAKDARESGAEAARIAVATAKAARKAADAAMAQIQIVKNKERGRLRIEFGNPDLANNPDQEKGYELPFELILDGATQVYISESSCFIGIHESGDPVGEPWWNSMGVPKTITPEDRIYKGGATILTGEKPWGEPLGVDEARVSLVRKEQLHIFARGLIAYDDLFGNKWELRFNSRWKYYWNFPPDGIDLTSGYWESIGDNGEYKAEDENAKPN